MNCYSNAVRTKEYDSGAEILIIENITNGKMKKTELIGELLQHAGDIGIMEPEGMDET